MKELLNRIKKSVFLTPNHSHWVTKNIEFSI